MDLIIRQKRKRRSLQLKPELYEKLFKKAPPNKERKPTFRGGDTCTLTLNTKYETTQHIFKG